DEVLVVASSDMSHYLPDDVTRRLDRRAIGPMLTCDAAGLYDVVEREGITMCGVLPATAMLSYARASGATTGTLLAYGTSADAFAPPARPVATAPLPVPGAPPHPPPPPSPAPAPPPPPPPPPRSHRRCPGPADPPARRHTSHSPPQSPGSPPHPAPAASSAN